ncbi:STELLO glycosyltransferase family protein [Alkalihalobacillus sp. BA299]|uniref:STELLO glycosyltransferase family protein n=1 Tax=Alkalihalobacillus sp. BA299 TaxID=2815938 RepID=UPI001ADB5BFF|nr:STELLO glycosyltransferase family protein [Alkalihalobacillus sp. BA299]
MKKHSDERNKFFIVITTIHDPTSAIKKFSTFSNYNIIVVGDLKTPSNWQHSHVVFFPTNKQNNIDYKIIKKLPYNHYSRKMIGYLYSIQSGAQIIVDTDDDNIPKNNWGFPKFEGPFEITDQNLGFINIYKYFSNMHIWPRGLPLDKITKPKNFSTNLKKKYSFIGVWQGLADGDPDVDAIYRLTNNTSCYFDEIGPIVLGKGTISPFNSQNTAFRKELFPLLYLPAYVTFRFTDILRGLVAQPIMWTKGYHLGFTKATVVQERNAHEFIKDFESEIPCYLYPYKIIDIVSRSIKSEYSIEDNMYQAYEALYKSGIVKKEEIELLTLWLEDISRYGKP